jgi:hypothetical protein
MIDVDRFGQGVWTEMPVMDRRENDTLEPVVDRSFHRW